MISYLQGKILHIKSEDRYQEVDVLLGNGIGYRVVTSKLLRFVVGQEAIFHTLMVVREDSQTLYGFKTLEERDLFEMLISVSGIGPKSGISILSVFTPSQLYMVLLSEDFKTLSKVPGLGQKSAQKIVIELKNKIDDMGIIAGEVTSGQKDEVMHDLNNALRSLGFSGEPLKEYLRSAQKLMEGKEYSIEEVLKLVLKSE
ncbi:MAG: Holliday junction ATP-dependent DNA helicase RuvA [candidate division WS6 bacterium GW2011_GWF2_39_15]|uniref:Holliday junction branch migration complex subunit RuvA n=1 Tax=candidate division WS6 bacterium GW2011_GWF2_39_15 TaxID=1619100 RepID=A0A0G0MQI9_9BACT|nr:MAG: Holliday junction ATP-dependent DNA helicase RuvA [candidate division WS6 bacterium GW2011_GWF2_39_15]